MKADIASIRKDYAKKELDIHHILANPLDQFQVWFNEALDAQSIEVNAMSLATINAEGRPCNRTVLLKGIENGGFVFYTNYQSNKGQELIATPFAALNFFWAELERQVRIEGSVKQVPDAVSDAYFLSRPRESQIGAWASPQSEVIVDRAALEQLKKQAEERFENIPLTRPPHWGGFVVIPDRVEFWQGRPGRLHDRILYTQNESAAWKISRLAP